MAFEDVPHTGQTGIVPGTVRSHAQTLHAMANGTCSMHSLLPEASVPSVAASHAKRSASGTMLLNTPMRRCTAVTFAMPSLAARS